jgi:Leucine-rich repeat (LRR) protein
MGWIGNNKLTSVPAEVLCMLTQLRELQLFKNKLVVLPPEIGNLTGTCIDLLCYVMVFETLIYISFILVQRWSGCLYRAIT